MLQPTLHRIEHAFPLTGPSISLDQWAAAIPEFCQYLEVATKELFDALESRTFKRHISESQQGFLFSKNPSIVICEFRLCPQISYYASPHRVMPTAASPNSLNTIGLELSLVLRRGFRTRSRIHYPCLAIEFQVWGEHERTQFGKMLDDHKYSIERLLSAPSLEFQTACVFKNIEESKKVKIAQKLDLYYQNVVDDENQFLIQAEFGENASKEDIVRALFSLTALYA